LKETIDCLLIGHNEMDIHQAAGNIMGLGENSPIAREMNYQFIQYNNHRYSLPGLYNYIKNRHDPGFTKVKHIDMGNVFCLSIAYLGTYLHRHNLTFDYINSFQLERERLIDILQSEKFLTIAITTTFYTQYYPIEEIVSLIREYNQEAQIIVGGPFVANKVKDNPKTAMSYFNKIGANLYVYSSQGEATLVNIIHCLKNKGTLEQVANIYYKKDNQFTGTRVEPENNDLERNMVDWRLFKSGLPRLINVRSAVSCPFSCSFCGFPERAGKHYTVSVEAFESELNTLRDTGVKSVYIVDDTFNVPPNRFKDLMRMMIRNKYPFQWNSYFRAQYADRETLDLMAEAGCEGVNLGLESGSQLILDNMNKKVTVEAYRNGLNLLRQYDFIKMGTFIIGFPGEMEETVNETVSFIEESGLDYSSYLLWFCDPITPIYRDKERFDLKGSQFNWAHRTMNSETALNLLAEKFISVKNTTWLCSAPLNNLFPFAMYHQEKMDYSRIRKLIGYYNEGLAEKIQNPIQSAKDISPGIFEKISSVILNQEEKP
jgi:anaerobic magnesium-protoporphyrin IX monomethyl ester cyclase